MRVVLDADILSTFSRISRPDILNALFDEVLVPGSVVSEVRRAKIDTSAVKHVVPRLTRQELLELRLLDPRLGKGERECVAIAKHRNILLARSDRVVQAVCRIEGIDFLNLPRLLRFALIEGVIGREGVRELIRLIEFEENTTINGKDEIFR